jgi:hypothetical protein
MNDQELADKHRDNPSYKMINFKVKEAILGFSINDDSILNRQLKDIDDVCKGVESNKLDGKRKEQMMLLLRDIYQYREIEHCITASKFQVTKELFLIDNRIIDEVGLSIYSKTISILSDDILMVNFTREEINFMKSIRNLESQLDLLWDKFIFLRSLYIEQQNELNKELTKKKYDIININLIIYRALPIVVSKLSAFGL